MKLIKPISVLTIIVFNSFLLLAQENAPGRVPDYSVPYEYPTIEDIKEILNRIRIYYESTSQQKIIDTETGKEITDFIFIPSKLTPIPRY
jgi:hypothetical protein